MINHIVGNYKILDKIGEGGMGEVFRGVDLMLEREVAIKLLRPEFARRQDLVERFRTEAMALARFNHPNIATLYSFFRQGDAFFMVMEFVRGKTLDKVITQSPPLSWDCAVPLFCQALQGIAHAHRLGVVHRDIKPTNLILADTGTLKVLDFGIARILGTAHLTKGHCFGTLAYMAPEQIRGQDTDARTDVYTLGLVLYEMLTGRAPFTVRNEYELVQAQVEQMPLRPRHLIAQLPVPIEDVVMRALAKAPDTRFQTADEFRTALEGCGRLLPATRVSELRTGATPGADKEQDARSRRLYLPQLYASLPRFFQVVVKQFQYIKLSLLQLRVFLPSWRQWKRYPGVVALLLLVVITLGLIGAANIPREVVLSPAPASLSSPPPHTTTSTPQPASVAVSSVEESKPPSRFSPELSPSFVEPPMSPLPSFSEPEGLSEKNPPEEQPSQLQEVQQEDPPARAKRRTRVAKRFVESRRGQWQIIK